MSNQLNIKNLFSEFKKSAVHYYNAAKYDEVTQELEQWRTNSFNVFINSIQQQYEFNFEDNTTVPEELNNTIPDFEQYIEVAKEITKIEKTAVEKIDQSKEDSIERVVTLLKDPLITQFISIATEHNNEELKDLPDSLKTIRIGYILSYVLSGKASEFFTKYKEQHPQADNSEVIIEQMKELSTINQFTLNVNKSGASLENIGNLTQPGRNYTDGALVHNDTCWIIFATSDLDMIKQYAQLWKHTNYLSQALENNQRSEELKNISKIESIYITAPVSIPNTNQNALKDVFSGQNENFDSQESEYLNTIPQLTLMGNHWGISQADTAPIIDQLINTNFFSMGASTLKNYNEMAALKLLKSPAKEMEFLKLTAQKIEAISSILAVHTKKELKQLKKENGYSKTLCADREQGIPGKAIKLIDNLSNSIDGFINACAVYGDIQSEFIKDIKNSLGQSSKNITLFAEAFNGDKVRERGQSIPHLITQANKLSTIGFNKAIKNQRINNERTLQERKQSKQEQHSSNEREALWQKVQEEFKQTDEYKRMKAAEKALKKIRK